MGYKVTVSSWNANGIKTKTGELIHFLQTHNIDLMLLNETKLTVTDKLRIKGYKIYRNDRQTTTNTAAGGVAILVRANIPHTLIDTTQTSLETLTIKLTDNTHITAAYNNPRNNFTNTDLDTLLHNTKTLVVGDLNARHSSWNCHINNKNGTTLHNYTITNNANILHTNTHTHYPSNGTTPTTIDIIINKNTTDITAPVSINALNSDHNPIIFTLLKQLLENHTKTITSFKKTNWKQFRITLDSKINLTHTHSIRTPQQLEALIHTFTNNITYAKHKHTDKIKINPTKDNLPTDILQTIKQRNNIKRQWQTTQDQTLRTQINRLNTTIKTRIRQHRNDYWTKTLSAANPHDNSLWKLTKNFKKPLNPIPTLQHNNESFCTDKDKAEIIAKVFESVHQIDMTNTDEQDDITRQTTDYLQTSYQTDFKTLSKILTSPKEITTYIKNLKNQKSPGHDKIENVILKNLSRKALVQLTYLINAILKLHHFPTSWKTATITPIPKPKKTNTSPTNYRPISLLNSLSKITEKVILQRLNYYDKKHKIIPDYQFGFRQRHNTVQQTARIVTDITTNFNKDKTTAMVLLDVEKAFDKVWIIGLLHKLIKLNLPTYLIRLLNSYLTDRHFQVKINNTYSSLKPIAAGIPQGSVLGPKLFTIYVNDLPTFEKTQTALYADDTALYAHSFSAEVANKQLQIHIDKLQKYWTKWKIKINADKTEAIVFSKKFTNTKIFNPLKVYNNKITPQRTVKYLGIHLDKTLSYNTHIRNTIIKTQYTIKTIYPLLAKNSTLTQTNKKLLYTSILRPIITYASPIWCSASKSATLPLQRLQNKCLRLITGSDRYTRIVDLHEHTGLPYIRDYITEQANKFYTTQLNTNTLTKEITKIRQHNTPFTLKHKLPYQTLPIFHQHPD